MVIITLDISMLLVVMLFIIAVPILGLLQVLEGVHGDILAEWPARRSWYGTVCYVAKP